MIQFTKMHGIGNDYVYIDCRSGLDFDPAELAIPMSDRHTGVGGDGIILILPPQQPDSDATMRIFNADGSEGRMCGNGIRCVGKWLHDVAGMHKPVIRVDTLSGTKVLQMHTGADGRATGATVDMGAAVMQPAQIPVRHAADRMVEAPVTLADGTAVRLTAVSMGNPHGVVFLDAPATDYEVLTLGPQLERHEIWPERANIEWADVRDEHTVGMRVWERGSGETMACGTGACATAVAAVETGRCKWPVTVKLRGGDLVIDRNADGHILMTGPAAIAFTGVWP